MALVCKNMKNNFLQILLVLLSIPAGLIHAGDRSPFRNYSHNYQNYPNNTIEDFSVTNLYESFESTVFPPPGWIKINPDGGSGWTRVTVGTTPIPGWNGGTITAPPGGGSATAFCTWNTGGINGNDQWLVTPRITNIQSGDSLTFYLLKPGYTSQTFSDTFIVLISTTTPTQGAFTAIDTIGIASGSPDTLWRKHRYRIADYVSPGANVYIAFREKVQDNQNNGAAFQLDLVNVFSSSISSLNILNREFPVSYKLEQNYPNPFNPTTNIKFTIPLDKNNSTEVRLIVFNSLGQKVTTLINSNLSPGSYEYSFDGANLNSGIYYYTLFTEDITETRKMVLIK